jgi:N-methylhydantoinase A
MRVGIEVGGTFTDLVAIGPTGVLITKVPSTPANPDEGAFQALIESGISMAAIDDLAHGSTVATNAVLERKGGPIAFVTTRGFRDILALQRNNRTNIYDLEYQKPVPVVERKDSFEVEERMLPDGTVASPLNISAIDSELIPRLREGGYAAIAVCLLNAYSNPEHEKALGELIGRSLPGVLVTLSSEVTREFREFERASTATLSAYVQPVIDRYIGRFTSRLTGSGFTGHFSVMQSNGGRLPAEGMRRSAITALLSGPAAGVVGATRLAQRSGFENLITFDMGGTSTDVCLVEGGNPQITNEFHIDGLPVQIPVLDINSVGAGGGSLIWVDEGGMLRAGPQSAGADPGPACYRRGGKKPTLTDAHVVRNVIRREAFLGGKMDIDPDAARAAFKPLTERFGLGVEEVADSGVRIANANVIRAIQLITTQRGKDPRDYALVAFGGAGPLHAAQLADDLGIRTILVPPGAGVISAFGLLASDYVLYESMTRRFLLDKDAPGIVNEVYSQMRQSVQNKFEKLGLKDDLLVKMVADMRFVGQAFEVPVEIDIAELGGLTSERLRALFAEAHYRVYLHGAVGERPIEAISFRLGAIAPIGAIPAPNETNGYRIQKRTVEIFDGGRRQSCTLMSRSALDPGVVVSGAMLLEDRTSTIYIPAGWSAENDKYGNLILRERR